MSLSSFSLPFILVLLVAVSCDSSRIIGIPHLDHTSHSLVFLKIARELKDRGHEYTHVLPKGFNTNLPLHDIDVLTYQTNITAKELDQTFVGQLMEIRSLFDPKGVEIQSSAREFYCGHIYKHLLGDEEFIAKVKQLKPELFLCDSMFQGCAILSDMLQVPRVDISTCGFIDPVFSLFYSGPQPFLYLTPPMIQRENRFSFISRLTRSFVFTSLSLFGKKEAYFTELWREYVGDKTKYTSYEDLIRSVGIVLVTDDFAREETRPLHPNIKVIGPISASPAKPLPDDLERFLQKCEDGVILVSFGTLNYNFREDFMQTVADGLASLPYKVIWKLSSQHPKRVGENTHIVSWMPQNDLLAHNAIKLFITQGGLHSFLESVYHRVPMVVIPLVWDQHAHGDIAALRKIGIRLDKFELTASDIPRAVEDIMTDEQYQRNIDKISRLMKDRPRRPEQEGADWIEYALRHDGALHLSPDEVPLYQQCMLDVLAAFVGVVVIVVSCILLVVKIIFTLVRNRMKEKND